MRDAPRSLRACEYENQSNEVRRERARCTAVPLPLAQSGGGVKGDNAGQSEHSLQLREGLLWKWHGRK
jgi:hypothetical protein